MKESNEEIEGAKEEEENELFEHHGFTVDPGQGLLRIDKFLSDKLPNVTRNRIQNSANAGSILVNNKAVKSNYKIKPGDIVSMVLPYPPRVIELIPENIPLNIAYEDDDFILVNKHAGLVVHPGYGNYSGTLINALIYHFDNLPEGTDEQNRPGLVHRLDKDTTGLMVIAKNEISMSKLAKAFFDRTIERKYVALVWGDLKEDSGTIDEYIGRSPKNRKVMTVFEDESMGKRSITHYKVLQRFGYVTLIQCQLQTGRTHQIRIHMKYLGHPLFNDGEYGGDKILKGTTFTKYKQFIQNCFNILPRQALHAKTLGFEHPTTGENVFFESDLPQDMSEVIAKWKGYSESSIRE
ncbi:MAG: RluA family pseudouridine synthase [Flavobacteriales bacterium]|nr:RluA family pseudouridine synthase [Flavobacteriales bacterium]